MDPTLIVDPSELETLLRRALMVKAPCSLRPEGSPRLLGDLHLRGLEPGLALHLVGAKRRDLLPEPAAPVLVSILLGEEVLNIHTLYRDALVAQEDESSFPPVIRVAWPTSGVTFRHRAEVRVAAPDQSPLEAVLSLGAAQLPAKVLNLTEAGIGLGLPASPELREGMEVHLRTELPDGGALDLAGEFRHVEYLEGDPLPWRAGMVLKGNAPELLERLWAFVQQRRTDRSEALRQGAP